MEASNHQLRSIIFTTIFVLSVSTFPRYVRAQQQQQQQEPLDQQRTTLVVSPNANGQGVRVLDQSTGREVLNTNQASGQQIELEGDRDEDRIVSGLLEWLENKKKKKRPQVLPVILPEPPHRQQPKIIHIHINNHIQKHPNKHHKKHHNHKHGHYEDYHGGHYDHDKYYHGKHSWPLLSHHYNWDQDYYFGMSGLGGHGFGGSGGDDYAGYESKQVASKVAASTSLSPKKGSNQTGKKSIG